MTDDPDWINPVNNRKTPYTEEEINEFVEGFFVGLDEQQLLDLKSKYGEKGLRERVRSQIIAQDERNIVNLIPDDKIH